MRHALALCAILLTAIAAAAIDGTSAAKVAMAHAGVKSVGPHALYAAPDEEDGRLIYDVRFHDGAFAYAYEVSAIDGSILKTRRQALPKPSPSGLQGGDVGAERAKAVAVADAKPEREPRRIKVERDIERGRPVYEVEFHVGNVAYEYTIDAADGAILNRETERKHSIL